MAVKATGLVVIFHMAITSYIFTSHARARMRERTISEKLVLGALRNPTKILYDTGNRLLIKKLYKKKGQTRLLLIAGEITENKLKVITVIETSKVKKYL